MRKSRFTDSQIMAVLKQAEVGVKVPDLCKHRTPHAVEPGGQVRSIPQLPIGWCL